MNISYSFEEFYSKREKKNRVVAKAWSVPKEIFFLFLLRWGVVDGVCELT